MDPDFGQTPAEEKIQRDQGPEENPYYRLAMTLICVVAAGCVIVGGLNLVAYFLKCRHDHVSLKVGRCIFLSIPLLIGMAMLIRSSALARRLEQMFED
jgi:hypothetical protein